MLGHLEADKKKKQNYYRPWLSVLVTTRERERKKFPIIELIVSFAELLAIHGRVFKRNFRLETLFRYQLAGTRLASCAGWTFVFTFLPLYIRKNSHNPLNICLILCKVLISLFVKHIIFPLIQVRVPVHQDRPLVAR